MRKCKLCSSRMIVDISRIGQFTNNYCWVCTSYPRCHNTEDTIILKEFSHRYNMFNSMHVIRPRDILSDAERHFAICKHFNYDHKIKKNDLDTLDLWLGFETREDFCFWVATQQSIVTHSVHHHLPVGSPYYFTFKNLTDSLNQFYANIVDKISMERKSLIESSILNWTDYFNRELELRYLRQKEAEEKIQRAHSEAVKRKAEKASIDIFNAIRRKDLKAIEALKRKGADFSIRNKNGMTCLEFALSCGDEQIIKALTKVSEE